MWLSGLSSQLVKQRHGFESQFSWLSYELERPKKTGLTKYNIKKLPSIHFTHKFVNMFHQVISHSSYMEKDRLTDSMNWCISVLRSCISEMAETLGPLKAIPITPVFTRCLSHDLGLGSIFIIFIATPPAITTLS